jgi:hypothetical protein
MQNTGSRIQDAKTGCRNRKDITAEYAERDSFLNGGDAAI